jgi:hypothetical protein
MEKKYFYLFTCFLTLTSCNNSEVKRTPNNDVIASSEIIDTAKQEQSFLQKKALVSH